MTAACSHTNTRSLPPSLRALQMMLGLGLLCGCASPGPPRPPSLQLPQPVSDLAATRSGDTVTLQFTLPTRSTDKTFLRPQELRGTLCRQVRPDPACVPVQGLAEVLARATGGSKRVVPGAARRVSVQDALPPELADGRPRLLAYRVEFFGPLGTSAGKSDAAFAAAGAAPEAVTGLYAEGSREGVVLNWQSGQRGSDTVVLARETVGAKVASGPVGPAPVPRPRRRASAASAATPMPLAEGLEPNMDLLEAHTAATGEPKTLDASALPGTAYRYRAFRQRSVTVGGQTVVVRGVASSPVAITLLAVYAPAAPTELRAAGFPTPAASGLAGAFVVSLIWQPVNDAGVLGYNVERSTLDVQGNAVGLPVKLNAAVVQASAFDDATADPAMRYRYSVTAVDAQGNESVAAVVRWAEQ